MCIQILVSLSVEYSCVNVRVDIREKIIRSRTSFLILE